MARCSQECLNVEERQDSKSDRNYQVGKFSVLRDEFIRLRESLGDSESDAFSDASTKLVSSDWQKCIVLRPLQCPSTSW
jgi:hypothetical protein